MAHPAAWVIAGGGVAAVAAALWLTRRGSCPAGQLPIQLIAQGSGIVCAGQDCTRGALTICPRPGDVVSYQATPDAGRRFVRFEGPGGVTTTANPFQAPSQVAGFVRGVFT